MSTSGEYPDKCGGRLLGKQFNFVWIPHCTEHPSVLVISPSGGLPIKSDGGQNVKGTKFCQKLYHRVH